MPHLPSRHTAHSLVPALLLLSGAGLASGAYAGASFASRTTSAAGESAVVASAELPLKPRVTHLKTPEPLRALYMTACVVGSPELRESLVRLAEQTEVNALIIDIKDYSGTLSLRTGDPRFADVELTRCGAPDMRAFIESLHTKGIYAIGRITVFQDPEYTDAHKEEAVQSAARGDPWKDHKGLAFVDVSSRPFWEYIVALAKLSYEEFGFDELNFDYIRYPSDGPMSDAVFQNPRKAEALEEFFRYLEGELRPTGAVLSADLFGMTTTNEDDLNIGQVLERALPYFDYIAPMVYPSHYPRQFNGWANPNAHVYEVVHFSMSRAAERARATTTPVAGFAHSLIASTTPPLFEKPAYDPLKLRPWLQDFDYGGDYGPTEVRAQIQATYDAGLTSWMLWSPSNRYTAEALLPP